MEKSGAYENSLILLKDCEDSVTDLMLELKRNYTKSEDELLNSMSDYIIENIFAEFYDTINANLTAAHMAETSRLSGRTPASDKALKDNINNVIDDLFNDLFNDLRGGGSNED